MTQPVLWLLLIIAVLLFVLLVLVRRYRQVRRYTRTRLAELETLSSAGRAIVEAQLDVSALCELIAAEAARVIDTSTLQIGLFDGDFYHIIYWTIDGERQPQRSFDLSNRPGLVGWVRESRQTLTIGNYEKELDQLPAQPRYISPNPPRSGIFVPLLSGQRTLGVLAAQSNVPNRFSTDDVRRLTILANQAAAAISHAYLYERERTRAAQLELVGRIAQQVNAMQDLDEVMRAVVNLTRAMFGYHPVSILSVENQGKEAVLSATTLPSGAGRPIRIPPGYGLIGTALSSARTVVSNDTRHDKRFVTDLISGDIEGGSLTQAEMAIPLLADERLLGVLDVQSEQAGAFGPQEQTMLEALAAQVSAAIFKTRQWTLQREQAWLTTAQFQVAEAISQSGSLDDLLAAVCRLTPLLVGVDSCAILLWEPEQERYLPGDAYGLEDDTEDRFHAHSLALGTWKALDAAHVGMERLETKQPPPWLSQPLADHCTWVLYPLVAKNRITGLMVVTPPVSTEHAAGQPLLPARQEELLYNIALQTGQAIASEQSHLAQQEEAWVNTALLQVAEAVNSLIDLNEILDTIVRFVPMLVGVEKSVILVWDQEIEAFHVGPSYGISEMGRGLLASFEIDVSELPLREMQHMQRLPSTSYYSVRLPSWLETVLEAEHAYAVALHARGALVGALVVTPPPDGLPLSSRRLNILLGIAHQAAIALVNDQLYREAAERDRLEQELSVARNIQASFIPPGSPDIPGCSVASFWQAARQVSGDFYDFFELSPNRWGVLVADVADKGVPAALFMALSRTVLRAIAFGRRDPGPTLERANQIIFNDTSSDLFVTVFYAIWDAETGLLTYSNAGHNPPLLLRADGEVEAIESHGIALGVLERIRLETRHIYFEPGDLLVLYTDGVTEALNEDLDEFGVQRLQEAVASAAKRGASEVVESIRDAVRDFAGDTPQFDDITMVVMKRLPDESG